MRLAVLTVLGAMMILERLTLAMFKKLWRSELFLEKLFLAMP